MTTFARRATSWRPSAADAHQPVMPPPSALPRTGLLLVGLPTTIAAVRAEVAAMDPTPVIADELALSAATTVSSGDLAALAARHQLRLALICVPGSMPALRYQVQSALREAGIAHACVPGVCDLAPSGITGPEEPVSPAERLSAAPIIDLAALIGRTPHRVDREAVAKVLKGRRVLITGAGGSIGSELARVAAEFGPAQLILMERSENALFEIDRQMGRRFPKLPRKAVLHDVVDAESTLRACENLRPQVVLHAAAHKHVPLMEDHPAHAVTNNLFGTKSIADAAVAVGAERFVLISSDKAVNPTSVMGATKRLAEQYVRGLGNRTKTTRLSMVRFGNVLGSAASVLTIWSHQIGEGGPITITDPRMTRFFMTIPEAATLVIHSMTLSPDGIGCEDRGGVGVFVLDMGEPVRIVDLAERFVRAHGLLPRATWLEPQRTDSGEGAIDLDCTGIRPGEKLHEELAYAAEQLRATDHPGIRAWAGPGFGQNEAAGVVEMIRDLHAARFSQDPQAVISAIRRHVPEMRPSSPGPERPAHPLVG
ncbi:MAG: polysaccharide biosynthesis protein [Phycisphaerales bacterium]|nr:polysaccharide biosynthesis protein [Phycisphaerales bacterium]